MFKTLARERDQQELLRRLGALRADTPRRWGRMTAHQMVCHLSDGYRLLLGERTARPASIPVLRPFIKLFALYVPQSWPPGVKTMPEFDQMIGGTKPVTFDADVAQLAAFIERVARERRGGRTGPVHPIFGRMSASAWLRWGYLHADHHLRQFGL